AAMPESLREKLGVPSGPPAASPAKPSSPVVRAAWPARLVIAISAVAAAVTLALVLWPHESQTGARPEPTDNTGAVLLQAPGAGGGGGGGGGGGHGGGGGGCPAAPRPSPAKVGPAPHRVLQWRDSDPGRPRRFHALVREFRLLRARQAPRHGAAAGPGLHDRH